MIASGATNVAKIVGITVPIAVLSVILLIGMVVFCMRRKNSQKNHTERLYSGTYDQSTQTRHIRVTDAHQNRTRANRNPVPHTSAVYTVPSAPLEEPPPSYGSVAYALSVQL